MATKAQMQLAEQRAFDIQRVKDLLEVLEDSVKKCAWAAVEFNASEIQKKARQLNGYAS